MHGYFDTWQNRLKRPLYGCKHRLDDLMLRARARLTGAVRHVHGPRQVPRGENELVVICLVRNGELWIDCFIDHHLELGAKHIFFLDNGSSDGTLERIRSRDRVSAWVSRLPFRRYELAFRRWLVRHVGLGGWVLWCDVDELFDFPWSEELPLPAFLEYLGRNGYQVVAAQMLDMFSDRSFSELDGRREDALKEKYPYYDLREVEKRRDVFWIDESRPELFCTFGGLRGRVFGSRDLLQTKHPLVRLDGETRFLPYDGHFSTGRVADVTGVLLHYKFVGNLLAYAREAVRLKQYTRGSLHYRRFLRVLSENPDLSLHSENARRLERTSQLVEEGLLTVSEDFLRWLEAHAERPSAVPWFRRASP